MRPETSKNEISHYFEYSGLGLQVVKDGLEQMSFGEYLVSRQAISRQDLFRGLQLQDQNPGVRLGECLAKIGVMGYQQIEEHLKTWNHVGVVEA